MKKTLLAVVSISVAAFAYANSSTDSSALVQQQCKISAEAVSTLKGLRYGNTAIRKDVASLINQSLKMPENRIVAHRTLNQMVDDKVSDVRTLEGKYCS
jgi:limonene-1,2-epoxide hydrolase